LPGIDEHDHSDHVGPTVTGRHPLGAGRLQISHARVGIGPNIRFHPNAHERTRRPKLTRSFFHLRDVGELSGRVDDGRLARRRGCLGVRSSRQRSNREYDSSGNNESFHGSNNLLASGSIPIAHQV
jgi:hypothetical protein